MSEEDFREVRELTDHVFLALNSFGFDSAGNGSGDFAIEIDAGNDEASGVYAEWRAPEKVNSRVRELIQSQQLESPFLAQAGTDVLDHAKGAVEFSIA
ncbi:hypothetical protein ABTZ59_35150 [Streptomyces sp. NPDC094034]|uniref:hypothetical protein n=1 Tax=Streptomyces sp. NPDC094034 TaxID=3155309 RepID=UPI00332BD4D5